MVPVDASPHACQAGQKVGGVFVKQGLLVTSLIQMKGFSMNPIMAPATGRSGGLVSIQSYILIPFSGFHSFYYSFSFSIPSPELSSSFFYSLSEIFLQCVEGGIVFGSVS